MTYPNDVIVALGVSNVKLQYHFIWKLANGISVKTQIKDPIPKEIQHPNIDLGTLSRVRSEHLCIK